MNANNDYARLELLFRRITSLPALPNTVSELLKELDEGDASTSRLERIIQADPGLTAEFLRMSALRLPGESSPMYSSIRGAIVVLGFKAVKNIAVSLMVRQLLGRTALVPEFDAYNYARHSMCSAMLARYLYSRRQKLDPFESKWSADEVFALGLLQSLGIALLAFVSPPDYYRVQRFAKREGCTLAEAFQSIFEHPHTLLCAEAMKSWGLADSFYKAYIHLHEPWEYQDEYTMLCCVGHAEYLANKIGATIENWPVKITPTKEASTEVGISDEELEVVRDLLIPKLDEFLGTIFPMAA